MERYGLPPHVFVAFDGAYSVWLDIRRDRYFAIERAHTQSFHDLVKGWPSEADGSARTAQRGEDALNTLLKSGLLVHSQERLDAKDAAPVRTSLLAGEIRLPVLAPVPRIRPHHVLNMILAWILGAATLKYRGLAAVIARMRDRHTPRGLDATPLHELISVFALLRPVFFALRGRCLLSSVVLSEFLARYHLRTHCVFGVQARPFAAHCWLESNGRVLNDSVERVRAFTPILRI